MWLLLGSTQPEGASTSLLRRAYRRRHDAALAELVDRGEATEEILEALALAYDEALTHVLLPETPAMSRTPGAPRRSRHGLVDRTAALEEMFERGDPSMLAVQRRKESLERDIAWLTQFRAGF